ncbi:MAG: hypothetical protein EXS15_08595 [Phycisphaerales bacterium]|nr:hypothetical protein [Phycisphaerales bacterium]
MSSPNLSAETVKLEVNAERNHLVSAEWMVLHLGRWSSHPRFASSRLFVWFTIALIPWGILVGLALWWLVQPADEAIGLLEKYGRAAILWGLISAGFTSGLGLTAALAIIASRSKTLVEDRGTPSTGLWGGFGALMLLGSIPWVVPMLVGAGPQLRAVFAILGVLPLTLVIGIVLLTPTEDRVGKSVRGGIRWWTLLFPLAVFAVVVCVRLNCFGLIDLISAWQPVRQAFARLFDTSTTGEIADWKIDPSTRAWIITGLTGLVLSPVLVLALWTTIWLRELVDGISSERRKRPSVEDRVKHRPLLGEGTTSDPSPRRKLGFSQRTAGDEHCSDGSSEGDHPEKKDGKPEEKPPEWIEKLQVQVDPEKEWGEWVPKRFAAGETAPLYAGAESFNEFFCGATPSMDQVRAFTEIYNRWAKGCEPDFETKPSWDIPSADVLIQGNPGSGRTATAIAAIVQSVIVRGETVLVLVPNEVKRRSMTRRIRRTAEETGVGWFINVGDLTEKGVQPWAEPSEPSGSSESAPTKQDGVRGGMVESFSEMRSKKEKQSERERLDRATVTPRSTPDVLVGTLAEFEERFFAGSSNWIRLHAVIRRIGLIVVEDLSDFEVRDRVHLGFMLNKIRLIIGSEGLRCQTILVAPMLGDSSREFVSERLLTGKQQVDQVTLRAFARSFDAKEPWEVQLRATSPGAVGVSKVIEQCAKACIADGIEVLVFSPRMSASERRELAMVLEGAGVASIRVVSDLDELDIQDSEKMGAVFYSAVTGAAASMAIRAHAHSDDLTVFSVLPKHMQVLERTPRESLLVLPTGRSRALFAVHLRSATRFLRRLLPIHRSLWSKLGLDPAGSLHSDSNTVDHRPARVFEDRRVQLDPPDLIAAQRNRGEVWGWCCLASDGVVAAFNGANQPAPIPVRIRDLIEAGTSIQVDRGAGMFEIASVQDDIAGVKGLADRRIAEWYSEDRQAVGRDDLAYCSNLRFESDDAAFFPSAFHERDGKDQGVIRVEGVLWSERSDESVTQSYMLALRILSLDIPSRFGHKSKGVTALPAHVQLIESMLQPRVPTVAETQQIVRREVEDPLQTRQFITMEVLGTFDELGGVRKQSLKIRYEAATCFLAFNFSESQLESDAIQRDLGGEWGFNKNDSKGEHPMRSVVPELGAAFTVAMRRHAPGMERLGRCIGIRIEDPNGTHRFALLFVEPLSTSGSTIGLLSRIIRTRAMLAEFLMTAATALEQSRSEKDPVSLFIRAQICIGVTISEQRSINIDSAIFSELAAFIRDLANAAAKSPDSV